jgi:hypothetical protein
MPEVSIDKDGDLDRREYNVRLSWQAFKMLPKSQATFVQR